MEKLKNILKSDTPTDDQPTPAGATGKITGQGSHFPHETESAITQPTTVTGTESTTRGPSDVSAVKPDPVQAASTAGPEQGGSQHVNTTPATSTTTAPQSDTKHEAQSYNVTNADFPKTESSTDGSGTAAIGTTTTYKSSHLPQGDPLPSVIDKNSSDPVTYKKPESGASAATTAATTAFASSQERGPGHENPYRSADIDPRVDGGSKQTTTATSHTPSTEAGVAAAGATTAYSQVTQGQSTQPPTTLTSTTDPIDRSGAYSQAATSQGLDDAKPSTTSTSQSTDPSEEKTSMVGKVLGAVGLGGLAGTAAAKLSSDNDTAVDDKSEPTTTTGVSSYTSPTQQGPGTSHHRKESIPTTAYPAGVDSPGAINAPIGGTRATPTESASTSTPPTATQTSDSTTGHKAATAVAGAGAGAAAVGAAAVGNKQYEESKNLREGVVGAPTGSAHPTTDAAIGHATTGVPSENYSESKAVRDNATSGQTSTTTATTATTATEPAKKEDHTARDAAIGAGAGAAVVGAGAAGAHEYSKKEAEKAEAEAAKQQAARQKEIEEQQKAAQKQAEEQQKAAQKQAEKEQKAAEKEEKAHQKAVEKEEKKHEKELEKEKKQHEKEIAAAEKKHEKEEKEHQKQLEKEQQKQAEEEEERRKKAAAAAVVGTGAGTAAVAEHEHDKDIQAEEKEKKPSLLKRIFKKRKNSKTGEEEEYEEEEEDHHGSAIAGGTAVAAGAGGAAVLATREKDHTPTSTATTSEPLQSDPLASTQPPSQTGAAGFVSTGADGKPSYTVIPQPATESTTTATTASEIQPVEPVTGQSHGTTRDLKSDTLHGHETTPTTNVGTTAAAATTGSPTVAGEHGHTSLEERIEAMTHEQFGVVEDHKR